MMQIVTRFLMRILLLFAVVVIAIPAWSQTSRRVFHPHINFEGQENVPFTLNHDNTVMYIPLVMEGQGFLYTYIGIPIATLPGLWMDLIPNDDEGTQFTLGEANQAGAELDQIVTGVVNYLNPHIANLADRFGDDQRRGAVRRLYEANNARYELREEANNVLPNNIVFPLRIGDFDVRIHIEELNDERAHLENIVTDQRRRRAEPVEQVPPTPPRGGLQGLMGFGPEPTLTAEEGPTGAPTRRDRRRAALQEPQGNFEQFAAVEAPGNGLRRPLGQELAQTPPRANAGPRRFIVSSGS